MSKFAALLLASVLVPAYPAIISFGDSSDLSGTPTSVEIVSWTSEGEETEESGQEWAMISPPGLPPGALPSPEGGFAIDPSLIGPPEVGGYQWISQESYQADWLAFVLASNTRLYQGAEEEGEFEFPVTPLHLSSLTPQPPTPSAADVSDVPEPSSLLSVLGGAALLALMYNRRANYR